MTGVLQTRRRPDDGATGVGPFVGRARELAELRAVIEGASAGAGALCLVSGEAGVGKTTLCEALAAEARERGMSVAWGRAWESGGAPPYWPWIQVLRALGSERGIQRLPPDQEPLGRLLPELHPGGTPAAALTGDSPEARFALFESASRFIATVLADGPVLVVLDDVHAADASSLLLLSFLAQHAADRSLALVATHRDPERLEPGTAAALAEVARHGRGLRLDGLDEDAIVDLARQLRGLALDRGDAAAIHAATAGNAFFVGEVVRELASDTGAARPPGAPLPLPAGVREAVRRRLHRLGPATVRVLEVCAVVGRDFSLAPVAAAGDRPRGEILEVLERAAALGLCAPVGQGAARWRFSHAIVFETLLADLAPTVRMSLHGRVGSAYEALFADDPTPHLAELARHFVEAAPAGDAEKAVDYARRAAAASFGQLAWEDAAGHLERALEVLELAPHAPTRLQLLLRLGEARQAAGATETSREAFASAASIARQLQDPAALAAAALGRAGIFGIVGETDHAAVELLDEALEAIGDGEPALRVRLQARLALELRFTDRAERRERLVAAAVDAARRLERDDVLLWALAARYFTTPGTADPALRLRDSAEAVRRGERLQAGEPILMGAGIWHATTLLETGDVETARLEIERLAERGARGRAPWASWRAHAGRACLALIEGDLAAAERLAGEALAMGQPIQAPAALQVFGGQLLALRLEQGRLGEIEPAARAMVVQQPNALPWRAALALIYTQLGRPGDATRQLEHLARADFADVPDDEYRGSVLSMAAGAAAFVRDEQRCQLLYDLLEPYERRCVVGGYGTAALGPGAHWRGLVAAAAGRSAEAADRFASAVALERRMGAHPWLARTLVAWARLLTDQRRPDEAARLSREALSIARAVGIPAVADDASSLLAAGAPAARAEVSAGTGVFRREGQLWTVGLGGRSCRVRDAKGLRYIATLLASPNKEVHALDLVSGGDPMGRAAAGDAGVTLDDEARRAYAKRIDDLRGEIDQAEEWHDSERAAGLREELDFLLTELSAAVGLGGRTRRAGSDAERARVSVTRAIRRALAAIAAEDPELADYLTPSIRTGTFCVYSAPPSSVRWEL